MDRSTNNPPDGDVAKRLFDLFFAALGLAVLSPVFLLVTVLVKLSDGGPVLFRQERIGQWGKPFRILKFRSMVINAERMGLSITKGGDPRITRPGRFLRKTKLDEMPQLWNVLRGDMSFVGPRPEVPHYVQKYTPDQRAVLSLRPGITDLATLEFRNEEELLRQVRDVTLQKAKRKPEARDQRSPVGVGPAEENVTENGRQKAEGMAEDSGQRTADGGQRAEGKGRRAEEEVEEFYIRYCIPRKIELNLAYARRANLWEDTKIILRTLGPRFL